MNYQEKSLWKKIGKYALVAGKDVITRCLVLYYCMMDKDTPAWAKTTILSALAYFISPLDAIPDFVPAVGYGDDLGALGVAMASVAFHIKQEHRELAEEKLKNWF